MKSTSAFQQAPKVKKPMSKRKKIIIAASVGGFTLLSFLVRWVNGPPPVVVPTPTINYLETLLTVNTATTIPTGTPTTFLTETLTVIITETPAGAAVCDCARDYNCVDFTTHNEAQLCFVSCGGSSTYNFAELDGTDSDGFACESLP